MVFGVTRKYSLLTLFVVSAFIFAGCAASPKKDPSATPVPEGTVYSNGEHGFSVTFPETWIFKESAKYGGKTSDGGAGLESLAVDDPVVVIAMSPKEGEADNIRENVNIIVSQVPEGITVDNYLNALDAEVAAAVEGYVKYGEGKTSAGGVTGWMLYGHKFKSAEFKTLVYVMLRGDKVLILTCTAVPESYAKYEGVFKTIADSVTFGK